MSESCLHAANLKEGKGLCTVSLRMVVSECAFLLNKKGRVFVNESRLCIQVAYDDMPGLRYVVVGLTAGNPHLRLGRTGRQQ